MNRELFILPVFAHLPVFGSSNSALERKRLVHRNASVKITSRNEFQAIGQFCSRIAISRIIQWPAVDQKFLRPFCHFYVYCFQCAHNKDIRIVRINGKQLWCRRLGRRPITAQG